MANSLRQIQKEFVKQQPPPLPNRFLGKVGNRDGDWDAGNGYVYVRDIVSGITVEAKNLIGSASLGYAVWVEKRGQDFYIVDIWNYLPQGENEIPAQVQDHSHAWPDPNFTPIWPAAIMPFNVWPSSGFTVQIYGGVFMKSDGTFGKLANQTFDLTSYQPAAGALIVHFQYDDNGTVSVVQGTTIDDPKALSVSDIPAATQHSMRVGVKLYESQTAIRRDGQINDFYDWRFALPGLVDYALVSLNTLAIDGVAVYSTIDPSASPPDDGMGLFYDAYLDAWVPGAAGAGDMLKSVYDTDNSGVVDDTEAVDGVPVDNSTPPTDGQIWIYDAYAGVMVPDDIPSGSSLSNSSIAPTTSDITLAVNTRYFVDASGLTADRALKFPSGSDGDIIEIRMVGEHASYACKLQGDTGITLEGVTATEWDRLWNSGQAISFVYLTGDGWRYVTDTRTYWREIKLTGSTGSISIANIPTTKHMMQIDYLLRTDTAAINDNPLLQVNGDTGSNYYRTFFALYHNVTYATSEGLGVTSILCSTITGNNAPSNAFGHGIILIPGYSLATQKQIQFRGGVPLALTSTNIRLYDVIGLWNSTSAITSLTLTPNSAGNFVSGCYLRIALL